MKLQSEEKILVYGYFTAAVVNNSDPGLVVSLMTEQDILDRFTRVSGKLLFLVGWAKHINFHKISGTMSSHLKAEVLE